MSTSKQQDDNNAEARQWSDQDLAKLLDRLVRDVKASSEKQVQLAFSAAKKDLETERDDRRFLDATSRLFRTLAHREDQPATFPSLLACVEEKRSANRQHLKCFFGADTDKLLELSASLPKIRRSIEYWKQVLWRFLKHLDLDRPTRLWLLALLSRESAMLPTVSAPSLEFGVDSACVAQPKSELGWGDRLADALAEDLLRD